MIDLPERRAVRFPSGEESCAAWHYPSANGALVVMAGGLAVPKGPGTDLFAPRFAAAGFGVLAFDYRGIGESEGSPRKVVDLGRALADWEAAVNYARMLPGVESGRVAAWGFSATGGHLFRLAAGRSAPDVAILQTPLVDSPRAALRVRHHSTTGAQLRLIGTGLLDMAGGVLGREPRLIPLVGERGSVALLSTPDALEGPAALDSHRHPEWDGDIAARSVLGLASYRPGRAAPKARCPILVLVCEDDLAAPADLAVRAAERAPDVEIAHLPGGHYAPFLEAHEDAVELELDFLGRRLLAPDRAWALGA